MGDRRTNRYAGSQCSTTRKTCSLPSTRRPGEVMRSPTLPRSPPATLSPPRSRLLDGSATLPPREPLADLALTAELLKVPGATVEPMSGLVTLTGRYRGGRAHRGGRPQLAGRVQRAGRRRGVPDRGVSAGRGPVRHATPADAELDRVPRRMLRTAEHRSQTELADGPRAAAGRVAPCPAEQRDLRGAGRRAHHDARRRRPGHADK